MCYLQGVITSFKVPKYGNFILKITPKYDLANCTFARISLDFCKFSFEYIFYSKQILNYCVKNKMNVSIFLISVQHPEVKPLKVRD